MGHSENRHELVPDPLPPGFSLGRYVIGEELAPAGMGRVYKAEDTTLNETVAINVLFASLRDAVGRYRFLMRCRKASKAHNDSVHAFGEHLDLPYVVVVYLEGRGAAIDISQE